MYDVCYSNENQCDYFYSHLPDISFQLDFTMYTIPPSGYLVSGLGGKCGVAVSYTFTDAVLFGQSFMRNFYVSVEYGETECITKLANTATPPRQIEKSKGTNTVFYTLVALIVMFVLWGMIYALKNSCSEDSEVSQKPESLIPHDQEESA